MPKHRAGGKITGSHTTVTDAAAIVVDIACKQDEVTKIVLGRINSKTSRRRRLAFAELMAGLQVNVIGNTSMQTLYVYTSNRERTRATLHAAWPT